MSKKRAIHPIFLALPLLPVLGVYGISQFPEWIETGYASAFYPVVALKLRAISGVLPFSIGDVIYILLGLLLLIQIIFLIRNLRNNNLSLKEKMQPLIRISITCSILYTLFYLFWGINYYRLGIVAQLNIQQESYEKKELIELNMFALQKINALRSHPDYEKHQFRNPSEMFVAAQQGYDNLSKEFAFLHYEKFSLKPSLYSSFGNYAGFLGYYNPFTGEGQINTACPSFLQPFITCHEMAHQLGYASESEANFIGFLSASNSNNLSMQYSAYFEIFLYTSGRLRNIDSNMVIAMRKQMHTLVIKDLKTYKAYLIQHQSFLQPITDWLYDAYLKRNDQVQGIKSYQDVVGWIIAYRKSQNLKFKS